MLVDGFHCFWIEFGAVVFCTSNYLGCLGLRYHIFCCCWLGAAAYIIMFGLFVWLSVRQTIICRLVFGQNLVLCRSVLALVGPAVACNSIFFPHLCWLPVRQINISRCLSGLTFELDIANI